MDKIPLPITFNAHKHHFLFLKHQIEIWRNYEWDKVEKELLCMGENLLDFYTGELSVEKICNECLEYFKNQNIDDFNAFKTWLGKGKYRKIELSDSSNWVIKPGSNHKRYIHIHPAKYSKHSLRIRAVTLKTVSALQVLSIPIKKNMKYNLQQVNSVRKDYLGLSPVKLLSYDKGIFKIWRMFKESKKQIS